MNHKASQMFNSMHRKLNPSVKSTCYLSIFLPGSCSFWYLPFISCSKCQDR